MATATAERTNAWTTVHVAGPFEVYRVATHEHEQALTLGRAQLLAVHDSIEFGPVQVLSSDRTLIGWAKAGTWHGPKAVA